MGSVTIHLLVEKSLKTDDVPLPEDDDFHFESTSHILLADSSLVELMDLVELKPTVCNNNKDKLQNVTILDLSYNPVKNISSIVRMNTELSGPRSKTLHSMNWYPSGKLCILPLPASKSMVDNTNIEKGDEVMLQRFLTWQSRNVVHDEDFAYNDPTMQNQQYATANKKDETDNDDTHQEEQQGQTKPPRAKKKRSEKQRTQRLDNIIQNLARTSKDGKKKRVSDKVRTMLIKSRADGNKKLRMEDRFHLELLCLIDDGDNNMLASTTAASKDNSASSYRFFSRVTTAGRVASSVSGPIGKSMSVEFLVSLNNIYRRLPNTMSLHDAQQGGWLQEFDTTVIRTFSLEQDCQSKSVLELESDADSDIGADAMQVEDIDLDASAGASPIDKQDVCNPESDKQDDHFQQRLHMVYNTTSADKSAKKKKPVSKQVQRMLIKSKSTGNKGIKPDDRVHLDIVIFNDDGSEDISGACSSSFRFFSKRTSIEQLASTFQDKKGQTAEIFVAKPSATSSLGFAYHQLPTANLTLEDALKNGLEDFGRIIVRLSCE
ncbi:hypothetical protein QTG54_002268 [Skeletonema marinoi]|uniref:Uncharacterized protein n=1 Tax=Skeletonema marinoi TaxID=267567 RepID=A0AAD9DI42_9STRA|nr:hypothetical protein QTG54_002268 [Skeletonema marinoi]